MPNRKTSESSPSVKVITALAFIGFAISELFYIFAPTHSSSQHYDSSLPAVLWGVVFVLGGFCAVWGILRKTPHLERLGLMLVVIAGSVLTISQAAVMFEVPITRSEERRVGKGCRSGWAEWPYKEEDRVGSAT